MNRGLIASGVQMVWIHATFFGMKASMCVNKCVSIHLYVSVHVCVQRVGQAVEGTETACSRGEVSMLP